MIESKSIENQLHDLDSKRKLFSEEPLILGAATTFFFVFFGRYCLFCRDPRPLVGTPSLRYGVPFSESIASCDYWLGVMIDMDEFYHHAQSAATTRKTFGGTRCGR